jgi:CheY-like chemotaxis protein
VTTASTDEATADRVREAGAQQLLRKPHRERELLEVISRLLGVELVAVAPAAANAGPIAPLGSLVHEIPAPLVTALVEAASTARAARILELAAEIERHSPAAAEGIRHLADSFRYAALLEALGGNGSHGA